MNKTKVFINGGEGTTGLRILERFEGRDDIELILIASELRKDPAEVKKKINESDITFLCLPASTITCGAPGIRTGMAVWSPSAYTIPARTTPFATAMRRSTAPRIRPLPIRRWCPWLPWILRPFPMPPGTPCV